MTINNILTFATPILSGSLDSTLNFADFLFYIATPACIIITIIRAIKGRNDG